MKFNSDGYAKGMFDDYLVALTDLVGDDGEIILTKEQYNDWCDGGPLIEEAGSIVKGLLGEEHFTAMVDCGRIVDAFLRSVGLSKHDEIGGIGILR